MKIVVRIAWLAMAVSTTLAAQGQETKDPVDYVSPNIGGIGYLLTATIPYVQRPHGMVRLAPFVTPGITDRYLADKIYGFPAGPALLMASVGETGVKPEAFASAYDHDFETATPYYYEADLQTWGIRAEFTAAKQAAYYRFTFPASPHAHLVLSLHNHAEFTLIGDNAIQGSTRADGTVVHLEQDGPETREYFYAEFSRPLNSWKTWQERRGIPIAKTIRRRDRIRHRFDHPGGRDDPGKGGDLLHQHGTGKAQCGA